jgi:hypothetical protein
LEKPGRLADEKTRRRRSGRMSRQCQKTAKNQRSLRSFGWLGQLDSNRDKINFNMFAEVDIWHDKAKKREF